MAGSAPELVFNFAEGQNHFFVELAEALIDALGAVGAQATLTEGEYPEPRRGVIHVLLPPHEYIARSGFRPHAELLERCIGISAEQPATIFFADNVAVARELGAVFDISPRAVRAYAGAGILARHLQLGYSRLWDRFDSGRERDIDVLFLGRLTARRDLALSRYADSFEPLRVHLQIADTFRPGRPDAPGFVYGEAKRELLARAKVLLSVHGEEEPYFEWLRVAEAISAGCLVVSEHSSDTAPLRSGEHLLTGGVDRLGLLCAAAVDAADERERMRTAAYELLRSELGIERAAAQLAVAARELDTSVAPARDHSRARSDFLAARRGAQPAAEFQPAPSPHSPTEGRELRAIKSQTLMLLRLGRRLAGLELGLAPDGDPEALTATVYETPAWSELPPRRLAVIVPLYDDGDEVLEALASVEDGPESQWELVVVDDGSTDGGPGAVETWLRERDEVPGRLVAHGINRGPVHARNTGIRHSDAGLLLMLDADNQLRSTAIERLVEALDRDPQAAFAYGIIEKFSADGPTGLVSLFPWQPERLRESNYIDALAMIRREAIEAMGGYSADPRLALGWEDYDLWARLAEAGHHAAFVPEIIARYRVGHSSMVSVTNISATDAFAAVAEHAPRLMRGLRLPH